MKKILFLLFFVFLFGLLFYFKKAALPSTNITSLQTQPNDTTAKAKPTELENLVAGGKKALKRNSLPQSKSVSTRAVHNADLSLNEEQTRFNNSATFLAAAKRAGSGATTAYQQDREEIFETELELRRRSRELLQESSMEQVKTIMGEPSSTIAIALNQQGLFTVPGTLYHTNGTVWIYTPHPSKKDGTRNSGPDFSVLEIWFDPADTLKEAKWRDAIKN